MNVSAADIHAFFSCGDMTEATMVADMPDSGDHEEDCGDNCCGSACLCKASGSNLSLLPHQSDNSFRHTFFSAKFSGQLDNFISALHLLADPPPRPFS